MLSPEAAAFKPRPNRHQLTPVKSIGEAADNEEDDLCAWLRNKACLSEKVIGKARVRLDEQDVDVVVKSFFALQVVFLQKRTQATDETCNKRIGGGVPCS